MARSGSTNATPSTALLIKHEASKDMRLLYLSAAAMTVGILNGSPATAHHSSTYFDMDVDLVHENVTVVDFRVANPHGILVYVVVNDDGNEEEWNAELPSANFSRRGGVVESILSPGDKVTVTGWPGLSGRTRGNFMRMSRAEFPNGDVMTFTAISAVYTRAEAE